MTPTPTNKLRFVEREITVVIAGNHTVTKTVRILQQWWDPAFFTEPGEWRDVPVETE
jgi:hypothetical protein